MEELVIYDMTDGTRTSTELEGSTHILMEAVRYKVYSFPESAGFKNSYINVIHEGHKTG